MPEYVDMVQVLRESKVGNAELVHFDVSKHDSQMSAIRGGMGFVMPGRFVRLHVNGEIAMSNTRMEKMTNREVCSHAHGDVLIAGLGLGLILHPILSKPEVDSVLVIEQSEDVMSLVLSQIKAEWGKLCDKLTVVCRDIHDWKPPQGKKWNTIYFDIWPHICEDNLDEINKLHQRFKYRLDRSDPNCWMGSWIQDYLRESRQQSRRRRY